MSLTIAIQACCQVFQISYEDLVTSEYVKYSSGYHQYSPFITEKKFTAYFMYHMSTKREIGGVLNLTDRIIYAYYNCIDELLKEDPRHWEIIRALEEKYQQIQAKRMAS